MKDIFKKGDQKRHQFVVGEDDIAKFDSGIVHHVCATFKLAQAMEWASRLFVIDMKDEDEEGIGTSLTMAHKSPAFLGELVMVEATYAGWQDGELICDIKVVAGGREVALGTTGQKIKNKGKLYRQFAQLQANDDKI